MKREAIGHTKMKRLCRRLDIPLWQGVGLLESIWHLTAREAPRGDIGKLSDEDIALAIDYRGDESKLIDALIESGWLDLDPVARLVIHDWANPWAGPFLLDDANVIGITSQLQPPGSVSGRPYRLAANAGKSFQGSNVLGMGFVLEPEEAQRLLDKDPRYRDVLFPYLNGEDLNSRWDQSPSRWVINFHDWPLEKAMEYPDCFEIVERLVKPEREANKYSKTARENWWLYERSRPELYGTITGLGRVLVAVQTSKFLSLIPQPSGIVYSHMTVVFAFDRLAPLAALNASWHADWVSVHGSTLETRLRYIPSDIFETFPFPPALDALESIGERYTAAHK